MFAYVGTGTVTLGAPLAATVVAPGGDLELAASGSPGFRGSFFGKQIHVGLKAIVTFEPFANWDWIFPPIPIVECATFFDVAHRNAAFGYTNPLDVPVTIPVGPRNQLDPVSTPPPQVTTFLPGTHHDAFLAGFTGDHVTWDVGGQMGTADTTTPQCSLKDYVAVPGTPQLTPEGSSPVARSLLSSVVPDNEVGLKFETGLLPWGVSSQQSTDPPFQVIIDGQTLGSDAICGPNQLEITMQIGEIVVGTRDLQGCTNGIACGVPIPNELFEANIDPKQSTVLVQMHVWEVDNTFCGGSNDHEFFIELEIDNGTGRVLGGDFITYDPPGVHWFNTSGEPSLPVTCSKSGDCCLNAGNDHYGICWRINPNGKPRICTSWNAQYIDAGFGEDFAASKVVQAVPASFARAQLTLSHGGVNTQIIAPLDEDGCVPFDQTPTLDQLLMVAPNDLSLRMDVTSQMCLDPKGLGCLGTGNVVTGARFSVARNGEPGPATLCKVLTQDETMQDPNCEIVKQSQGGFAAWTSGLPPNPIKIVNSTQTDVTRVSGAVGQILKREVDTDGAMSVKLALIDRAADNPTHVANPGEIDILTNSVCPGLNDTCASDPIAYRGQVGCEEGQPPENCRLADDRWKMTIAHEIGHVIQRRASGWWDAVYDFNGVNDIPGAPPLCRCDQVAIANGLHCLQSLERPSAAQVEGYAQYFANKTWNDITENDATFVYYKEFLATQCLPGVNPSDCVPDPNNPGLIINPPPQAFDLVSPIRWRNNQCITSPAPPGDVVGDLGVELDWLGFYYNTTRPGTSFVLKSDDLMTLYRITCSGSSSGFCSLDDVSWDDCPTCSPPSRGIHTTMRALQQKGNIPLQTLKSFETNGMDYGVDRETQP